MTSSLIDHLVEYRGIESNYTDAWGSPATIHPETKQKLLGAMGYTIADESALLSQVDDEVNKTWLSPLNPVQVVREGNALQIALRLPIELVTDEYSCEITTEHGEVLSHCFVPIDGQLVNIVHIQEIEFQEYLIDIPLVLLLGYHQLELVIDEDVLGSMRLVIAPTACYKPETLVKGGKVWGLSVQLYCLRSEKNWGVGDFSDLTYLIKNVAAQGAHFVGLNPIHALYPANPDACSPYGPSSRRWLNFIYIDVSSLDGYDSEECQKLTSSPEFQTKH